MVKKKVRIQKKKNRKEIVSTVKLIKWYIKSKTVKCKESRDMNYSVVKVFFFRFFFFARRYFSGTDKQPDLWNEILKTSYLHECRAKGPDLHGKTA